MILRRLVLIPALVLIWPVPSFAQTLTTAQLQQIGQQYAAQYGVPWSIFEAQIQAESSWNPNVGCNSHGACGIAQFLPSTAAQFNLDPNDPVASLQAAAQYDAQLHQQDGSWVAALTAYSGGLTPANPADYGPVFAAAETADGGTATAGGGGLTISTSDTGTIASAAAAAGVTAGSVSGSAFNPFSYLWSNYDNAIAGPLASELAAVQAMIQAPLLAILSLSVMVMAIGAYSGRIVVVDFFNRLLRIAAVVGFCGVGSQLYGLYVVQLFGSLPVWFSSHILGATSANPAAGFDAVIHLFNEAALTVWWGLPWSASTLFMDAPILGLAYFVVFVAVGLMFTVWIISQALLQILIVLGPLIILSVLFDFTSSWFGRWISAMLLMALVTLTADMLSSLVLKVIIGALNAMPAAQTNNATQGMLNLVGVAMVVFVLSAALAVLPVVLQHLAAASGAVSMDHAHHFLSRGSAAAGRAAGRASSAVARAARG